MNFNSWYNVSKLRPPVHFTYEQFYETMKPITCEVCRRLFNPTNEEREKDRLALEEVDKSIFEWEVNMNYEADKTII